MVRLTNLTLFIIAFSSCLAIALPLNNAQRRVAQLNGAFFPVHGPTPQYLCKAAAGPLNLHRSS